MFIEGNKLFEKVIQTMSIIHTFAKGVSAT
jgi:hypothetical protein